MGMRFRPRRPVRRMAVGAATAGVAYHAGKKKSEQQQVNDQAQAAYQATQAPPPPQQAPPPPAAGATDQMAELEKLAEMHGSGVLTDEEFAAAKAKLLGL